MQLILLENIMNLGKIGDTVKVKNGYGRNFLLKQGKALRANKENINLVNKKKDELNKKNNELKKEFINVSKKLNNKKITFKKESKDNGDLYGTLKPKEISSEILNKLNVSVEPSKIIIKQMLNKIGTYSIDINLHSEVQAKILIEITKIEATK
tara:strand:- start:2103 stop:2561 length:459 start_codon:yes stop_codon:yes gene_type:complete